MFFIIPESRTLELTQIEFPKIALPRTGIALAELLLKSPQDLKFCVNTQTLSKLSS